MAKRGKKPPSRPVSVRAVPKKEAAPPPPPRQQQQSRSKQNGKPAAAPSNEKQRARPTRDVEPPVAPAPAPVVEPPPSEMPIAPIAPPPPVTLAPSPAPAPVEPASLEPTPSQIFEAHGPSAAQELELRELLEAEPPHGRAVDDEAAAAQPTLLFEIAWEVCWQLGGIYTVLRTKAAAMLERWDERYCLIGPYNPATAALEFEERPTEGIIRETLDRLRAQGIPCHYGRWLISGRPRVILLDYRARFGRMHEDKYLMWRDHGIDTAAGDGEVNEVVAFGFTVAEFFRELASVAGNRTILAHFHEWMGGVAVPRIAHLKLPVTTVFTTHATLLGRYLASDNPYFYQHLPFLNADTEARKYNILPRHLIEKAAAHASTVFTTVSEVTAFESEKLLGRAPEAILPNGLNIQRFAALHEFQNLHQRFKEKINEFVMGHFFPSYTFDLDKTLYFFTSGRYEYRNKGIDLFIEALARLNQRLRPYPDRPTIVAFVITRAATRNINVGVLQSQAMFDDLRNTCADVERQMGRRLFLAATTGRLPTINELLPDDTVVRMKRAMHVWRTPRQPTIVTHDLADDAGDPVMKHLRHRHLLNAADDAVKVVFHPEFATATSPLLNLDYTDFVRGCHMGVFPSYYEPWGYTPMESIALGVPAITTDLSGFGAYVNRHIEHANEDGVFVLNRRNTSFEQSAEELTNILFQFCQFNRRQRIEVRNKVERLSEMFDWSTLINHYHEAHDMALERTGGRRPGVFELRII